MLGKIGGADMNHYKFSSRITLYASRFVMLVMVLLLLTFPFLVERYHQHFRLLLASERTAIIAAFYVCALPVLLALWNMDQLLRNILREQLFILENVQHIRIVRWCCVAVSFVCLCAAFGFPSLIFLAIIMAFLSLAITVVGQVMKAAVVIREENDLTI